jgi:Beta-propeller repeat
MRSHQRILMLTLATLFTVALTCTGQSGLALPNHSAGSLKPDQATQGKILQRYGKLPLSFEANQGQADTRVKFLSRGSGYTLFLTSDEAIFSLRGDKAKDEASGVSRQLRPSPAVLATNAVLQMKLVKANRAAKVTGTDELPGTSNYFIGNDPAKWRGNVPTYSKVKYEEIYSGIDLVYYGNQRQLEYDFVVAPGADPSRIRLKFRRAGKFRIDDKGDLVLGADGDEVRLQKPQVYQYANGTRKAVEGHYWMAGANTISFRVAAYDRSKPLVIDPVLVYSTYLGGSGEDAGYGIAVDTSGNAYVTGYTLSTDFPIIPGAFQTTCGGGCNYTNDTRDVFVSKLNASGSALIYSTYLGGSGADVGFGIAVDSSGDAYVIGRTNSTDFPTMNPFQAAYAGGQFDAFVAKLNPTGSALVYSTYLGGNAYDSGQGIAVDTVGNAYVTGATQSANFPTMNPLQPAFTILTDVFVAQLSPSGSALVYSTYLGGSNGFAVGRAIAIDSLGEAYVTGDTDATDFPVTPGAFQTTCGGCSLLTGVTDAFVTKLNPTGSALVYSTYLGGAGYDFGYGIAVDSSGDAYVTGVTESTNFPTINPLQPTFGGSSCCNAFVTKLNPTGSALVYSTYLGGSGNNVGDQGYGIAVDSSGDAYVTGLTTSTDFPTMNPLQLANAGNEDAFMAKLNLTGSALVYSTYLGGSDKDEGYGVAVDSSGNAYVTGWTQSTNFPTMNSLQPNYAGGNDAFVAKINGAVDNLPPTTVATASPGPNINGWNNTNVIVYLNATDNTGGSGVEQIQFSLSGAENPGLQTVAGNAASVTITPQGITTLTYFATDNAGNQETAKTLTVRIDKTPPVATATPFPTPNGNGWNNTNVTVSFTGTDNLSGIDSCSGPVTFMKEGAGQIATGTCTDKAGNVSAPATAKVNIDKTPPVISGLPARGCTIWPPNHKLVRVAKVTAADALSGLAPGSFKVTGTSNDPDDGKIVITGGPIRFIVQLGADKGQVYKLTATARDLAGNTVTEHATCTVPHDQGR